MARFSGSWTCPSLPRGALFSDTKIDKDLVEEVAKKQGEREQGEGEQGKQNLDPSRSLS